MRFMKEMSCRHFHRGTNNLTQYKTSMMNLIIMLPPLSFQHVVERKQKNNLILGS